MAVILDPELKSLMAQDNSVAVLWPNAGEGRIALLAKAADQDVASFKGEAPIQTYWELGRFACGSVLRMHITIFDQPNHPYRFETFINVASPEQFACVNQLMTQETLQLHFFDSQTEHGFTKVISYSLAQRGRLKKLITQALQDWEKLGEVWDFDQAKSLFQAQYPL
jgi:hypothetical protein